MNTPNIACYSMGRFTTSKPNYRFWFLQPTNGSTQSLTGSKLRVVIRLRVTPETPKIAEIFGRFRYSLYLCIQDKQVAR